MALRGAGFKKYIFWWPLRYSYLLVAPLRRVVGVPGVRPAHRLPLEPTVLDLDVAAGRFVTGVVEAAHLGPH